MKNMIALSGFSRFPTFFSSNGRQGLGFKSSDNNFNQYVKSLNGKFVAIYSLSKLNFKSRFVTEGISINAELKSKEVIPKYIFIYPSKISSKSLNNCLAYGILLKVGRGRVYIPLVCRRSLDQKEVNALLGVAEIKEFGIPRFQVFFNILNIRFEIERELAGHRFLVNIDDPRVYGAYKVLIDNRGKVLDVDFCVHGHEGMFLTELVMFARDSGSVHHLGGFHY